MFPQEIIRKKRNKQKLTAEEIKFFVDGLVRGEIADSQMASLSMAMFLNGMDKDETVALTRSEEHTSELQSL